MKKEEVLERLNYLDTKLTWVAEKNNGKIPLKKYPLLYRKFRKESVNLPIARIRQLSEEDPDGPHWGIRRIDIHCKVIYINPTSCCTDNFHHFVDTIKTHRGERFSKIIAKGKSDTEMKTRIKVSFYDFHSAIRKNPVVVKKHNNLFEVWAGNHRVMAAISNGIKEIPVLCVCRKTDLDVVKDYVIPKRKIKLR